MAIIQPGRRSPALGAPLVCKKLTISSPRGTKHRACGANRADGASTWGFSATVAIMNRAVAWSVRGVGRETRDAAQEAARRAGMSLGEWLDEVIADQAAEQGVDPEDFDQDARLDAIGDRLSRLGRRDEPAPGRFRRDRDRDQDQDRDRNRDRDEPRRRPRAPIVDDAPRAEELLDAAISKFENRAAESDAR